MVGIKLINIKKYFGEKLILDNISFSLEEGKILCLLGASGCGKSTTLKIISGLIKADEGKVFLGENLCNEVPTEKRGAVIVFQDFLLFPHMNVLENIGFGLKMSGKSKEYIKEKVNKMIEMTELSGLENKYPSQLSGGQKQRVALARALAIEPKVLLLDEPFTSLDINIRNSMREFVLGIQKKLNITTILVTHDKEEALMMGDIIAVMINGKIVQKGTPEEVYEKPICKEVANFFGERNYINGVVENGKFKCMFGDFDIALETNKNSELEVIVKPEDIKIINDREFPEAIILNKKYAGDRMYYTIKCKEMELKCLEYNNKNFKVGDKVNFYVDFSNITYI